MNAPFDRDQSMQVMRYDAERIVDEVIQAKMDRTIYQLISKRVNELREEVMDYVDGRWNDAQKPSGEVRYFGGSLIHNRQDSSSIDFLQSGTGATTRTVQTKLREVEVSITDFGATDGNDIAAAFADAVTALPQGGTIVIPETATFWNLASQISTPDGTPYIIKGRGYASQIRKGFNGDMISLGKLSKMENLYLNGLGATYTGKGVIITTGANDTTSWRRLVDVDILDMQSNCIAFTNTIAGFMSSVRGGLLTVHNDATYTIALPSSAETNGNRQFIGVIALTGGLIDLGGSQNTLIQGCENGSATTNDAIKFSANTIKARVIGNRFVGGTAITVLGSENVVIGNVVAMNISLGSGAAECVVKDNNYACIVSDASGGVNNYIDEDFVSFTPVWTTSGTAPSLGNGSLHGNYSRKGRKITVWIEFVAGSTTTFGTGGWSFSLPYTVNSGRGSVGPLFMLQSGTAFFQSWCSAAASGSTVGLQYTGAGGNITATVPFTWAANDTLTMEVTYNI